MSQLVSTDGNRPPLQQPLLIRRFGSRRFTPNLVGAA